MYKRQVVKSAVSLKGTVDSKKYFKSLQNSMLLFSNERGTFQQGNVASYKTSRFLNGVKNDGICIFNLPPCSPDMNSIKNIWLHSNPKQKKSNPTTTNELPNILLCLRTMTEQKAGLESCI